MTQEEKIRVQQLRREGKSYGAIAGETGIPYGTIATFLQNHADDTFDTCLQCGVKLVQVPKQKKKKFCCPKCRTVWWNSHMDLVNRQAFYRFKCKYCGKEFWSYGKKERMYCSRPCADAARRKRIPLRGESDEVLPGHVLRGQNA